MSWVFGALDDSGNYLTYATVRNPLIVEYCKSYRACCELDNTISADMQGYGSERIFTATPIHPFMLAVGTCATPMRFASSYTISAIPL